MYTVCNGCGLESPAWHVYNNGTCIDCAPDSMKRYDELDALNAARDDMRAGRY